MRNTKKNTFRFENFTERCITAASNVNHSSYLRALKNRSLKLSKYVSAWTITYNVCWEILNAMSRPAKSAFISMANAKASFSVTGKKNEKKAEGSVLGRTSRHTEHC